MIQPNFFYSVKLLKSAATLFALFISFSAQGQVDFSQLDDLIAEQARANGPGVSIGVLQNGEVVYQKQSGLASLTFQVPINESTSFRLASVSKQFTAACIGILNKKGLLSVEDDVRKYIPELPEYGPIIRVENLLNHTSGIRNHNVLLDLMGYDYQHRGYTNTEIQELIFKQTGLTFKPGEKMSYTNSNYVLLALIVERVAGIGFEKFAQKELFEPLGMEHTFFQTDVYQLMTNKASHYLNNKEGFKEYRTLTVCNGAGGMVSTVKDMLNWSTVFLDEKHPMHYIGDFLTQNKRLNNGERSDYARGVFVNQYKGLETVHHSGREQGLRTQWIILPEKETAIAVFANQNNIDVEGISYQVIDLLFPSEEKQDSKDTNNKAAHNYKKYIGDYQEINSDLAMTILVENDTVKAIANRGNFKVPLVGVDQYTLHRINAPQVTYQFPKREDASFDMLVDFAGAKFYFEDANFIDATSVNIAEYAGSFYSSELDVEYDLISKDGELLLSYPNNQNIALRPTQKDEFGSGRRTRYTFQRNTQGNISGFNVAAEGTVKDILFNKLD